MLKLEMSSAAPAKASGEHSQATKKLPSPVLTGCMTAIALAFTASLSNTFLLGNVHPVVGGKCYRCAQPSGNQVKRLVGKFGIATVINLRGPNPGKSWYEAERLAAQQAGVTHIDVPLWAYHPPSEKVFRLLLDTLEKSDAPILMHCYSGADRAGFASACYLLLKTKTNLDRAKEQLSIRFGHNPFGRASCLTKVLNSYSRWLAQSQKDHSPAHFSYWVHNVYSQREIIALHNLPAHR